MLLVDFIRKEYPIFKDISNIYLWQFFQSDLVFNVYPPIDDLPHDKVSFYQYRIKTGTKVEFFSDVKFYGDASNNENIDYGIKVSQLEKDMDKIKGLGNKGIESFKEVFGHSFTFDELEERSGELYGVGNMTLNNIVEFYKR